MIKQFKRIMLVILVVAFLFVGSGCDELTNLFNNATSGIDKQTNDTNKDKDLVELVKITFQYDINISSEFTLEIKKDQAIYEPVSIYLPGYDFVYWYEQGNKSEPFDFNQKINEDLKLIGLWEESEEDLGEYALVTFSYNMPGVVPQTIKIAKATKTLEPVTPLRVGFSFVGWYLGDNRFDFNELITDNITLVALWEETTIVNEEDIDITFDFQNDTNPVLVKVAYGQRIIEPKAPQKTGYTFIGWVKNDGTQFNFQSPLTNDLTLKASWQEGDDTPVDPVVDDVIVIFNYSGVPFIDDIQIKVARGSKAVEAKPPINLGFIFIGWFVDLNDEVPFDFNQPINQDLGLIAKWEQEKYVQEYHNVIFVYEDLNEELIINKIAVKSNFTIDNDSIPLVPKKNYHNFIGWFEDGSNIAFDFATFIEKDYIFVGKWALEDKEILVSFMEGEQLIESKRVQLGDIVSPIELTENKELIFVGWQDEEGVFFDFNQPIYKQTILYAVFYPSLENHINYVSQHIIRGNVKIYKNLYEINPNFPIQKSTGSGVIVKQDGNSFYVLTNSHVTSIMYKTEDGDITEAPNVRYIIEDYSGNEYIGELIIDGEEVESVSHDLAILKFTLEEENDLKVIEISETYNEAHLLTLIGQPHGQKNTITIGKHVSSGAQSITTIGGSKQYEVIRISAPGASGSSGSMVINQDYEIVGIVFAGKANTVFVDSTYMIMVPLSFVHLIMAELEVTIQTQNFILSQTLEYNNFIEK